MYVKDNSNLKVLLSSRDNKPLQLERCFHSQAGRVVLFMEAEPGNNMMAKKIAGFRYDLNMQAPRENDETLQGEKCFYRININNPFLDVRNIAIRIFNYCFLISINSSFFVIFVYYV